MTRMTSSYGTKSTASTAVAGSSCGRGRSPRWQHDFAVLREGFGNLPGAIALPRFAPAAPSH